MSELPEQTVQIGNGRMPARIRTINQLILAGFFLVALALAYWSVWRGPTLLLRDDNPRLVEAEFRVQRGRILDRANVILAESTGPLNRLRRLYSFAQVGPAVGYYDFRYGVAGVEQSFDAQLRGINHGFLADLRRNILNEPFIGRDVRLTLDASLQRFATDLMGERNGAAILLSFDDGGPAPTADVLAMVSRPGYDPNDLSDRFEALTADPNAPLLNRVTQGRYQPGLVLQPFILAYAVDNGLIRLDDPAPNPYRPVAVGETVQRCVTLPDSEETAEITDWYDVLARRCPGPLQDLGAQLGPAALDDLFARFGLSRPPDIPITVTQALSLPVSEASLAAIGQENLTISPLQAALALSVLAQDGRLSSLRLIDALEDAGGEWVTQSTASDETTGEQVISREVAELLRLALPNSAEGVEFSIPVISGPEGSTNVWYLGLSPEASPRYGVVVVLEQSDDLTAAENIGREILTQAAAKD